MREFKRRGISSAIAIVCLGSSAWGATGDHWIVSGWPQVDGTWLFDYTEGAASATNPRVLNFSGNTASIMVSGLDFDNQGRLFAMGSSGFYEVNPANGDLTLRGAFGVGIEGSAGYDPVNNRFLVSDAFTAIEAVDLVNFTHTPIASISGIDDVSGIAVDGSGRIWFCAANTNTTGICDLYELQGSTPVNYGSMGVSAAGAVCDLDFDSAGNLTLVSGNNLYKVSTTFGSPTATLVSPFTNSQAIYSGIALAPVPEPGMMLLAAAPLGLLARRRKARHS
ncbi:MAG: hypothetical protein JNM28_06970 [Armatimonadetes bacterium]|nr:hypothetical protein [Armatimonadota bacterium]